MPKVPAGMEYRNLGTMERNVDIFAKRMKGAKVGVSEVQPTYRK